MRKRRLPPLNALKGFEAAARQLSFTRAAAELNLTQGAVSRQVKELETDLGQDMFVRHTRRIELTPEGEQFYRVVEGVFDELERAALRLARRRSDPAITITALPTIATVWLMPRLHQLVARHPEIEARIVSSIEAADLLAHDADIAIRVGRLPGRRYDRTQPRIELPMVTRWDGVHADELFPDRLVPVCVPELLAAPVRAAADLAAYPLIHTTTRRYAWPDWLRANGVRFDAEGDPHLQFGHFFMALDAARQGRGIALVPDILLGQEEGARGLCIPYWSEIASAGEYYLLIHESRLEDARVQMVRSWILDQAVALRGLKLHHAALFQP